MFNGLEQWMSMLRYGPYEKEKDQNKASRDENCTAWDEKYAAWD